MLRNLVGHPVKRAYVQLRLALDRPGVDPLGDQIVRTQQPRRRYVEPPVASVLERSGASPGSETAVHRDADPVRYVVGEQGDIPCLKTTPTPSGLKNRPRHHPGDAFATAVS